MRGGSRGDTTGARGSGPVWRRGRRRGRAHHRAGRDRRSRRGRQTRRRNEKECHYRDRRHYCEPTTLGNRHALGMSGR